MRFRCVVYVRLHLFCMVFSLLFCLFFWEMRIVFCSFSVCVRKPGHTHPNIASGFVPYILVSFLHLLFDLCCFRFMFSCVFDMCILFDFFVLLIVDFIALLFFSRVVCLIICDPLCYVCLLLYCFFLYCLCVLIVCLELLMLVLVCLCLLLSVYVLSLCIRC